MEGVLVYFAGYLFALKVLLYITSGLILLCGLDDLFMDLHYMVRSLWRRHVIYRRHPRMTESQLKSVPAAPLALLIPAWQEAGVIGRMLENTLQTYDYTEFHLFVGAYPNDPETIADISRMALKYPQIHLCRLPHDGPSCKADCLNHILRDIFAHEKTHDIEFAGFVLHDAEDMVHPLELRLYNYLLPRKDMIQIPVIPMERPWHDLTGGHYMDEFAENHGKELVVREAISRQVPSAGVGCALSRRAVEALRQEGMVFSTTSLTEDYDLALRLKAREMSEIFVRFPIYHHAGNGRRPICDIIATREYFPNRLGDVIRQKSRWIMGIVFQGWRQRKWPGSLSLCYMLYRDRRSFFTAHLAMLAYFLLFNIVLFWILALALPDRFSFPALVRRGEPLEYMLWATGALLVNRVLQRGWFCYRVYGGRAALMSLPRQIWANVINCLAGLRAVRIYGWHLISHKPLVWDKTCHHFPDDPHRQALKKRLGLIFLEKGLITLKQLNQALAQQDTSPLPLGQILLRQKLILQKDLEIALQEQQGAPPHALRV